MNIRLRKKKITMNCYKNKVRKNVKDFCKDLKSALEKIFASNTNSSEAIYIPPGLSIEEIKIIIDTERLKKAMNSETITIPDNLSREERREFILSYSNKGNI